MKKNIFILSFFIVSYNLFSQIGINYTPDAITYKPKSPLVIMADKNEEQNMLRFNIPNHEVQSGEVLISDDKGNVNWGDLSSFSSESINGEYSEDGLDKELNFNIDNRITNAYNSGAYVDLSPGIWNVNFDFKVKIKKRVKLSNSRIIYMNYKTDQKLTPNQFYSQSFAVKNAQGTFSFDATVGDEFRGTSDCENIAGQERCYYYFTNREVVPAGQFAWVPIDRDEAFWVRLILSDNERQDQTYGNNVTKDLYIKTLFLASGDVNGAINMTSVRGQIYIQNKTQTNKKYYLKVSVESQKRTNVQYKIENFAAGPLLTDYDRFFALPVNR